MPKKIKREEESPSKGDKEKSSSEEEEEVNKDSIEVKKEEEEEDGSSFPFVISSKNYKKETQEGKNSNSFHSRIHVKFEFKFKRIAKKILSKAGNEMKTVDFKKIMKVQMTEIVRREIVEEIKKRMDANFIKIDDNQIQWGKSLPSKYTKPRPTNKKKKKKS